MSNLATGSSKKSRPLWKPSVVGRRLTSTKSNPASSSSAPNISTVGRTITACSTARPTSLSSNFSACSRKRSASSWKLPRSGIATSAWPCGASTRENSASTLPRSSGFASGWSVSACEKADAGSDVGSSSSVRYSLTMPGIVDAFARASSSAAFDASTPTTCAPGSFSAMPRSG